MKAEIAYMKKAGGGVIINTASIASLKGFHTMSAYCAANFVVVGLTRAAAAEYASDKIRINAMCPGHVATPMTGYTNIAETNINVQTAVSFIFSIGNMMDEI